MVVSFHQNKVIRHSVQVLQQLALISARFRQTEDYVGVLPDVEEPLAHRLGNADQRNGKLNRFVRFGAVSH